MEIMESGRFVLLSPGGHSHSLLSFNSMFFSLFFSSQWVSGSFSNIIKLHLNEVLFKETTGHLGQYLLKFLLRSVKLQPLGLGILNCYLIVHGVNYC